MAVLSLSCFDVSIPWATKRSSRLGNFAHELVGHSTLTMTLRYMHLAPSALTEAIGLLNYGQPVGSASSGSC